MRIFEEFKAKVIEGKNKVIGIRKGVEDFKTKHKMANEAISTLIKVLPSPFKEFGGVIWNGLEKQDDSDQKMLEILEKIANNNEAAFMQIITSINKLIENNASKDDLQELGEEIITSNKEVVEILDDKVDEILSQVKETRTDVKEIKLGVEMLLKQGASGQIIQIQELETELHPKLYRGEKRTFVGREYYIDTVKECLKNPGARVSLVGLGGTGKSALAFKTLHQCKDMFYQIIPFYFESQYKIDEFMSILAESLSMSTQDLEKYEIEDRKIKLLNALGSRGEKHSLIFADNYETISQPLNDQHSVTASPPTSPLSEDIIHIDNFLNRVPDNTSILLTSRERKNIDNEKVIDLAGLEPDEGKELFIELAGSEYLRRDPPKDVLTAVEDLVDRLGGHPLSIEILARSYREGSAREEIQNMSMHLGVNMVNPRETQERLRSLNSSFEYSIKRLDRSLQDLLHSLVLFKSPFPLSAALEIFGAKNEDIKDLYYRSLLQRINADQYGQIREQEFWLYTFHPAMRNYLDEITKNDYSALVTKYQDVFSGYYLKLLYDTYISIGKENHIPSLRRFDVILERKDNDFDRAMDMSRDRETSGHIATLLALILMALGRYGSTLRYFRNSVSISEDLGDRVGMARDYNNIGLVLRRMGNNQEALDFHNKALQIEEGLDDRDGLARDYSNIGLVLSNMGNNQEALDYLKKGLQIEEGLGNRDSLAADYSNIGLVLSDMGNNQGALDYLKKALQIHENLNDRVSIAADYGNIGLVLRHMGNNQGALDYHNKALKIHENLNDRVGLARDYSSIGLVLSNMGKYQEALDYHNKALQIEEGLGDRVGLARDYSNIGLVLSDMGNNQGALDYHSKALQIHENLVDRVGIAADYSSISLVLSNIGNNQGALDFLKKVVQIHENLNDRVGLARDYSNMSLVLSNMGNNQGALDYHNKALQIEEGLDDRVGLARDYSNMSLVLSDMGNHLEALDYLKKALQIHENLDDKVGMARDYGNMSLVLSDMGNNQGALDYLKKALQIHENLNDRVSIAADYGNIGLVLKKLNKNKEAVESVDKGLTILSQLEKETGYHHPLIESLKQITEDLDERSI